jgi:hypothetical protein
MSPENETLAPANPEALDVQWYERLRSLDISVISSIEISSEEEKQQKEGFLEGTIENPHFFYGDSPSTEELKTKEAGLFALKQEIKASEPNPTVKQAYLWKINEGLAQNRMIQQVNVLNEYTKAAMDPATPEETLADLYAQKQRAMRKFRHYSEFIYGSPSKDIFSYSGLQYKALAESLKGHEDPDVAAAAENISQIFAGIESGPGYEKPSQAAFETIHQHTLQTQGGIIDFPPSSEKPDRETLVALFQKALDEVGATEFGFQLVTDNPNAKLFNVKQGSKTVEIPESLEPTYTRIRELIAHEIGTHVVRRIHGERSKLLLLGLGLDRYDIGEEGTATARE